MSAAWLRRRPRFARRKLRNIAAFRWEFRSAASRCSARRSCRNSRRTPSSVARCATTTGSSSANHLQHFPTSPDRAGSSLDEPYQHGFVRISHTRVRNPMRLSTQRSLLLAAVAVAGVIYACTPRAKAASLAASDAASKVYVPPGSYDEFYAFLSGGYSGQVSVYGLPSGRLLKLIPVFSQFPEDGYGYNEETKPLLQTTYGFVPWDDSHHPELSQTNGVPDGRWLFINANNTPRVARIDLTRFETDEILQIPNSAGGHASPFTTPNSKYVV